MNKNITARTKIIATTGPSSWDDSVLREMYRNGMSLARINASFADFAELKRVSDQLRNISPRIAIILDTQGNKIRVKNLTEPIEIKERLILSSENVGENIVNIGYPKLHENIIVGSKILLDDGNIQLIVNSIEGSNIICNVIQGGILKPNKTVNIPDINLTFPVLTEKDRADILFAIENNFDFVCASFVRNKEDVRMVRELLGDSNVGIISKIENKEGVKNFTGILQASDGIMIARGDLGVEIDYDRVPILQKQMIQKCREAGKPVIVATQMLESMRENIRPTRAEVSDVANAVLDGADCLMLSAETSTGKYPAQSVATMYKSILTTESVMQPSKVKGTTDAGEDVDEIGNCIFNISQNIGLKSILLITDNAGTIGTVSRHRPNIPIYVVSSKLSSIRRNIIYNSVKTYHIQNLSPDRDQSIIDAVEQIYSYGELDLCDKIAIISGSSIKDKKGDSILEILTVKDILK
ncbi:MAG: pyruvate kinase [Candidatus Dojkabacteria bacterium]|jgi:pyruvate kinase